LYGALEVTVQLNVYTPEITVQFLSSKVIFGGVVSFLTKDVVMITLGLAFSSTEFEVKCRINVYREFVLAGIFIVEGSGG